MSSIDPITREKLRQIIERVERLESEKQEAAAQIKDVFAEAKSFGFDVKALRDVIKHRKQDPSQREEHELVLETYLVALGDLPLFESVDSNVVTFGRGE